MSQLKNERSSECFKTEHLDNFKPIAFIFIWPQSYTLEFIEHKNFFTLSFFEEKYRAALNFCGANFGRDYDKAKQTGLVLFETRNRGVVFEQARMVLECKKMYFQDINPANFIDGPIENNYPNNDCHRMFVSEVVSTLI